MYLWTDFDPLAGLGFCYSITKGPENATVLAGSEARFNCTVSAGWRVLIWLSKGSPVLTVISSQGSVETTERFTSQNYTRGDEFTSELIIHNTQLSDSGRIECSIQQPSQNNFAFLSVQGVYGHQQKAGSLCCTSGNALLKLSLGRIILPSLFPSFASCLPHLSLLSKQVLEPHSEITNTKVIYNNNNKVITITNNKGYNCPRFFLLHLLFFINLQPGKQGLTTRHSPFVKEVLGEEITSHHLPVNPSLCSLSIFKT